MLTVPEKSSRNSTSALSPAGHLARCLDPDRFLCALLAPAPAREGIFALLAFNGELLRIPERVSEPALGQIRLQWWRETLETGGGSHHEVLPPLFEAIHRHALPLPLLMELIDQHEIALTGGTCSDAALYRLMLACAGITEEAALLAADKVGLGYAARDGKILSGVDVSPLSRTARLVLVSRCLALRPNSPWRGWVLALRAIWP